MSGKLLVRREDPVGATAARLIRELSRDLAQRYRDLGDDGSGAFDPQETLTGRNALVVARMDGRAVGCGALRAISAETAEIKRVYVAKEARRRGVGRAIVTALERLAKKFGYRFVRLETGRRQPEAIALYQRCGFSPIPPFGRYVGHAMSLCFEKQVGAAQRLRAPASLAERIIRRPMRLEEIFAGLESDTARVRYECLKALRLISERSPKTLYPAMGRLVQLLEQENKIMQWGAIMMIGNLAAVDAAGRIENIVGRYLRPIDGPVMITAANVIGGAGRIARAKPHLADRIAKAILRVEQAEYQTAECRNVAIGHAISSLEGFFEHVRRPGPVLSFVKRQLANRRPAVRRKAERFLRKCERGVR